MSEGKSLTVLLGVFCFLAFGYSVLMPIWEAPDEPAHYIYALGMLKDGRPPEFRHSYEVHQPVLYYWGAGRVLWVLERIKPTWVDYYNPKIRSLAPERDSYRWTPENYRVLVGAQVLRWVSVVMGGITVYCIYQGAKIFTEGDVPLSLAGATLAGLTPQFVHISSSVTNDVLGNLAGAGMFWLAGLVCTGRVQGRWLVLSAIAGVFLPVITKLTALPMGLTLFAACIWQSKERWNRQRIWGRENIWIPLTGLGIGVLMLAWGVYSPTWIQSAWEQIVWRAFSIRPDIGEIPFKDMYWAFVQSYWGKIGWLTTGLEVYTSQMLTQFVFLGWVLAAGVFIRQKGDARTRWGVLWLAVGLAFLVIAKNTLTTPQFQGRFFFPEIGAISLLAVTGWASVFRRWIKPYIWLVILGVMTGINLWLWLAKIIPLYFQPFLDWH